MSEGTYHDYDFEMTEAVANATEQSSGSDWNIVLLIIGIVMLAALIGLVITMMIKTIRMRESLDSICIKLGNMEAGSNSKSIGVVFCKKCGCSYAATEGRCPFCGTKK